jgi:hypothetical protein
MEIALADDFNLRALDQSPSRGGLVGLPCFKGPFRVLAAGSPRRLPGSAMGFRYFGPPWNYVKLAVMLIDAVCFKRIPTDAV